MSDSVIHEVPQLAGVVTDDQTHPSADGPDASSREAVLAPLAPADQPGLDDTTQVAPFVPPRSRRLARQLRRDRLKRGFVAVVPEGSRRRHRILPRTVIGITMMLLAAALGAGVSGAVLYAYYDYRLTQNESGVEAFVTDFDEQFAGATASIEELRDSAVEQIRADLAPLESYAAETNAVAALPQQLSASVWFLSTLDTSGRPSVGTAFVVASEGGTTLFVTSYEAVAAAAADPGPALTLRNGDQEVPVSVWSWDVSSDLALLSADLSDAAPVEWASNEQVASSVGTRVYAISGLGGQGASATPGIVVDLSDVGLQHTAPLGTAWRGAPLVDADGRVLGVASLDYEPLNFPSSDVRFAIRMSQACETILTCASTATGYEPTGAAS